MVNFDLEYSSEATCMYIILALKYKSCHDWITLIQILHKTKYIHM